MGASRQYTESLPLIRATADRMQKLVVQQLFKNYLIHRLMGAGNMLKVYETLEVPFYVAPPQLGKWIGKGDTLPDAQSTLPAMGYVTNRYVAVPNGFDMLEMMEIEHDPSKVIDMSDLKSAEAAWALYRTIAAAVWSGTGGKQPDGLSTIIEKAVIGGQSANVMGVDKATKLWFNNQYVQLADNFGALPTGSTIPWGLIALMDLIDKCTVGTLVPSDVITTKAIFNLIKRAFMEIASVHHMITKREDVDYGFARFRFDGAWIAWDPNCPDDSVYALHIDDQYDGTRTNDPRDKTKLDWDLEKVGATKVFDLRGSLSLVGHPNIQMRPISARSPYRHLTSTEWTLHSCNLAVLRMSDQGVAGSDNGSRWSTWA